jgi:hypothetical protein
MRDARIDLSALFPNHWAEAKHENQLKNPTHYAGNTYGVFHCRVWIAAVGFQFAIAMRLQCER